MIKTLWAAFLAAFLFAVSVSASVAQLTRSQISNQVNSQITHNGTGAITGPIMNSVLNNLIASVCFPDGLSCPLAQSLTSLQAISSTAAKFVYRSGYAAAGDGGGAAYSSSPSPCSLNAGNGDGGAQVKSSDGNCFLLIPPAEGVSVMVWGAVADGVTDNTAAFNAALANSPACVLVPPSVSGFYIATSFTVKNCLRGTTFNPNTAGQGYAHSSVIVCNNQAAQACAVDNNAAGAAAQIANLSFIGIGGGGTPVSGSIGLQWKAGYNLILDNVQIANFGQCAYLGPTTGTSPISIHYTNSFISRCSQDYIVDDGTAELYFIGGRWGENGGADYNSADAFVYSTRSVIGSAGSGPNTLVIDSVQINPGNKTIGCAFSWGNFIASSQGGASANKIANSHVEVLQGSGYTGSGPRGMFCVDSTVPHLPGLVVSGNDFLEDGGSRSIPPWNIDTAVPWDDEFRFSDNFICGASGTTTIGNIAGNHRPLISGGYICSGPIFAGGAGSAQLTITNVDVNPTFNNHWSYLALNNIRGVITDNSTGAVYETNDAFRSWTPQIAFGGASVGVTYATQNGSITRNATGGYEAWYFITLTSKGSSTGAANIVNIPYTCGSNLGQEPLSGTANFASLVGNVRAQTTAVGTTAILNQDASGTSGVIALGDANFTNTTSLQGKVTCGTAQ